MDVICVIDHESLVDRIPMATPCGHLYCFECADMHFRRDQPKSACAVCRSEYSWSALIQLYPTSAESRIQTPDTPTSALRLSEDDVYEGQRIVEACRAIKATGEITAVEDVAQIMTNAQAFLDNVAQNNQRSDSGLLKLLAEIISDLGTKLKALNRENDLLAERRELMSKLERMNTTTSEAAHKHKAERIKLGLELAEVKERETLLHSKLQRLGEEIRVMEDIAHTQDAEMMTLQSEMAKVMKSCALYKKKYHSLKQQIDELRRTAVPSDEEDAPLSDGSLEIAPPLSDPWQAPSRNTSRSTNIHQSKPRSASHATKSTESPPKRKRLVS